MEPPSPYVISILNESQSRVRSSAIRRAISATLGRHGLAPGAVDVLITNNAGIQALNRQFRELDEPTDVLTFPATESPSDTSGKARMIGDIAISFEYAKSQAAERRVSLEDELSYLAVHGALHLCGFDDVEETDRRRMQIAMAEMGNFLGLKPDPAWTSVLHAVVETEHAS